MISLNEELQNSQGTIVGLKTSMKEVSNNYVTTVHNAVMFINVYCTGKFLRCNFSKYVFEKYFEIVLYALAANLITIRNCESKNLIQEPQ